MEKAIKYKRFSLFIKEEDIQNFFDELVLDGWEIIYYNEMEYIAERDYQYKITVVASKKQSTIL